MTYIAFDAAQNWAVCSFKIFIIRKFCNHFKPVSSVKLVSEMNQFYTVNLGFTGVYLFFLFLIQNTDCGYSCFNIFA